MVPNRLTIVSPIQFIMELLSAVFSLYFLLICVW